MPVRRSNSRIVRSALDEIKTIKTLLADVYKDAGDGRTILRELVQNADDAGARRLAFVVLDRGWSEAGNTLLRGPALLVANDGPFRAKDHEALHQALGGSKAEDVGKIGRFGIGLKSVFHICEAIVYVGAEQGVLRPGALNPWAGTGDDGDADPLHPDWDVVADDDLERLLGAARQLFGRFDDGLIQWIPLRRPEHLDRAKDRKHGLGTLCPTVDDVGIWFGRSASLTLLLAQCGHLVSIDADRAVAPEMLRTRTQLARVHRPANAAGTWLGRHDDDLLAPDRRFEGVIQNGALRCRVLGVEALGHEDLRQLRSDDWPHEEQWREGRLELVPQKALAHAAVTILRPEGAIAERVGARFRWAVFLPLDDDPNPGSSPVVETVGSASDQEIWEIVIHGYFWPSHDRRSIPGITDNDAGAGDSAVRTRWNQAVRDKLLLPLLPSVLAKALIGTPERVARELLRAVENSATVRSHLSAVTLRHWLLPLATQDGVRWEAHDATETDVVSLPAWTKAPVELREHFSSQWVAFPDNVVVVDADAPSLGGNPREWPDAWIECLLGCVSAEVLRSLRGLEWVDGFVRHVLGAPAGDDDERTVTVARWLAKKVGEEVLASTAEGASDDQKRMRSVWRRLFEALPARWLLDAPVESQQAVVELAANGTIGEGLFPVPLGRRPATPRTSHPDLERVDHALVELGRRLRTEGESKRIQRSRLILAETLLSARGDLPISERLGDLPLLRARRLPDDRDEAWSVGELRRQVSRRRVFARESADGDDDCSLESPSDPKRAATDLANALGANTWLVEGIVGATAGAPVPTSKALADAVLNSESIQSDPAQRRALLQRLAEDPRHPSVQIASRILLTGRLERFGDKIDLFYVRSQDSDYEANRRTMENLLRLLGCSWCAVEAELVDPLPLSLVQELNVRAVDAGLLDCLLGRCLAGGVDWARLMPTDAVHLLRRLFGTEPEQRSRWRAMPLHRNVGGSRGPLDGRTSRAVGTVELPETLRAEIRLLDPDPELAHLYQDVPVLDDDRMLEAMLVSAQPHHFIEQILCILHSGRDGSVTLPRGSELRALLKDKPWLPHCNDGSGLSPRQLLEVPPGLRRVIAPLVASGALGGHRLPEVIDPSVWSRAQEVVRNIVRLSSPVAQVHHLARALNPDEIVRLDGGRYVILPEVSHIDASLVDDALQTALAGSHAGWSLVRAAATAVGIEGGALANASAEACDAVLAVARRLCGTVPAQWQINSLMTVAATRPGKESPGGRVYRVLFQLFCQSDDFFSDVLPRITLPTQDGQWHSAHEIARTESGLANRHRVAAELRPSLRLNTALPVRQKTEGTTAGIGAADTATELARYFEAWDGRVPKGAVGTFLSLLGNGKNGALSRLAQRWLGDDVSVDGVRRELLGDSVGLTDARAFFSGRVARGQRVEVLNLLGARVEMESGKDHQSIFAADPDYLRDWQGCCWNASVGDIEHGPVRNAHFMSFLPFWSLNLRDVEPRKKTAHELLALLGGTVEWWAVRVLHLDLDKVRGWWSRWGRGSQAQIGPVQASILAHLPLTLRELVVQDCEPLRDALGVAQRAQRKREQAPQGQLREATAAERAALDDLASLVRNHPEHQKFLWGRVQDRIERFGYRPDSVLLELAQNADDALTQAAEISGGTLSAARRRLVIRVHECEGVPTVDITHYGRAINDTGGASFPAGKDRQWDQDLYFMMLLNLSGKPGEAPGQSAASSTTGRFGLGFKSVHLVSSCPTVVSGFLAFSIVGGLLPREQPIPNDPDLLLDGDPRATRIRLPLRSDRSARETLDSLFRRFIYARALLPAFARQLREVVVEGGPSPGISSFDAVPIEGAVGWSVAAATTELPNEGSWRILRFLPADAGRRHDTVALAVGLRDGVPTPFPSAVPFLWSVAPTSEGWGCGYAINGPFKLDPGRTHVSLDDEATRHVVDLLGAALGRGLVELHDALVAPSDRAQHGLPTGTGAMEFLASLWTVLASGIDTTDDLRRELLLRLHGPGRGLSAWMGARAIVPSGLPAPFPSHLPPLEHVARIEEAVKGLNDSALCRAFCEIGDVVDVVKSRVVVSTETARRMRPLIRIPVRPLQPADILAELARRWDRMLTPERLHSLRPFASDTTWKAVDTDGHSTAWHSEFVAQSADGSHAPLRRLLLPRDLRLPRADTDLEDEQLRAAFAPASHTLASAYIMRPEDVTVFLRLRVRHGIDAATMSAWYLPLAAGQREAALRYLLRGRLQGEVLAYIVPFDRRPAWLQHFEAVRRMLDGLGEDHWRCQQLMAALFPDHFASSPVHEPVLPEPARRCFFERLQEWWNDADVRREVISSYEAKAWPSWLQRDGIARSLQAGSRDHWLGLLVLGACRSLGRTHDGHHRSFLESANAEGWWRVFASPDDTERWMGVLRTWQDRSVGELEYLRWMSLFPTIYQLSRHLDKYQRLLSTAGRRRTELYRVTCLLAPRVDVALTGAGQQFDAPPAPLNMGLHWVLRELVRMEVIDGDHLLPDCWVPSEQVLRLLRPLGFDPPDEGASNPEKAHALSDFLASALNSANPHLHRAFDIPLRHIAGSAELRRHFGLEE